MLPERRYSDWLPGGKPPKRPLLATFGVGTMCLTWLGYMALVTFAPREIAFRATMLFLGLMAFSYLLTIAGVLWEIQRRGQRVPLGEGPQGVPQFSATAVLRREVGYGAEEGLVSFVDGWLVFSGASLGFSLRRGDVALGTDPTKLTFAFQGPHGPHRVILHPLGSPGEMREAWAEWARGATGPAGEPLYPPVLPSPTRREVWAWRAYVVFIAAMGLFSLRVSPVAGAFELSVALVVAYLDLSGRAAFRRLARGEAPRLSDPRGAYWALRQGEAFRTVVHRALGRAERALR